jgi:outer membrane lipoprotein SlyB
MFKSVIIAATLATTLASSAFAGSHTVTTKVIDVQKMYKNHTVQVRDGQNCWNETISGGNNNNGNGAVGGAVVGGIAGKIVGGNDKGAAVGAILGAIIGSENNRNNNRRTVSRRVCEDRYVERTERQFSHSKFAVRVDGHRHWFTTTANIRVGDRVNVTVSVNY